MGKIAFIRIAHKDYQEDMSREKGNEALENIKKKGIDNFSNNEPLVDPVEAREFANKVLSKNVDGILLYFDTWAEPSVAMALVLELKHLPLAIWGFPMFEYQGKMESTGSFVAITVFSGSLKRLGISHSYIHGLPDDENSLNEVIKFVKVAETIKSLRATRIGLVGYAAMSMYPGTFDHLMLRGIIGPEVLQIDSYSLINLAESANKEQYRQFEANVKKCARIGKDVKPEHMEKEGRLYYGIKELARKYDLDAINVKCQYELSQDWGCIPCPALSLTADEGLVSGCEGDVLTTSSQVILNYLSGQSITYGDILNVQNGEALFSACGFAPYSTALDPSKVELRDIGHSGFNGPVVSLVMKKEKVTYMRLNEKDCGYIMGMGTGEGLDTELRQGRFPALKFKINGSQENFLKSLHSQHYALCYGDYTEHLKELCKFLNIDYFMVD
ncbi:MAG: hypothetical protein K8S14_00775 [Actinomycetia bacterium]|nr:hypothetical protein [Actinomycetes bacterium]